MWVITGTGQNTGKEYTYEVPASLDTDKLSITVSAYQQHGSTVPDDPMTMGAKVEWRSDNVVVLDSVILLGEKINYSLEVYNADEKVWNKVGRRAYKRLEGVEVALEEESTNNPDLQYRIRATVEADSVISTSRAVSVEPSFHLPPQPVNEAGTQETLPDDVQEAPKRKSSKAA